MKYKVISILLAMSLLFVGCATNEAEPPISSVEQSSKSQTAVTTQQSATSPQATKPQPSTAVTMPQVTTVPVTSPQKTEPQPTTAVTTPQVTTAPVTTPQTTPTASKVTTAKPVVTTTKPKTTAATTQKVVITTAHVHSYGAWVIEKAPTCTNIGIQIRSCACGASQTGQIAAKGHSFSEWSVAKAATCTDTGTLIRSCACGFSQTSQIAAKGHSFSEWTVTKAATEQDEGEEVSVCNVCKLAKTRSIAKLPTPPSHEELASVYDKTARELLDNIIDDYYSTRTGKLKGEPTSNSGEAYLWAVGSFIEAVSDVYALDPQNEEVKKIYISALDNCVMRYQVRNATVTNKVTGETFRGITYYNSSAGNRGDYYYDDDAWICYQFLNAYVLLGDQKYLTRAEELLEFFKTGWDDNLGGGIYWDKGYGGKNTCSNGPISICFLWAHQLTGKQDYLDWGKKIFDWMHDTLCENGLYCDNISNKGEINHWKADYNQGTPMYAASLIYEITGDTTYLSYAKTTANAAQSHAFRVKGSVESFDVTMNGNPIYKSWCVGWLMRGFYKYIEVSGDNIKAFAYMENVLDKTLAQKNKDGYYDPYFLSGDWKSESVTDVLQPCGVASVIAICSRYEQNLVTTLRVDKGLCGSN